MNRKRHSRRAHGEKPCEDGGGGKDDTAQDKDAGAARAGKGGKDSLLEALEEHSPGIA